MVRALERGLKLSDFNDMTIGMIFDYIITYNNVNSENDDDEIEAAQVNFDAF